MKATELMMGDLVFLKQIGPVKISSISDDEIDVRKPDADGELEYYIIYDDEFDELTPIPITTEILDKNFKESIPGINLMYDLRGPYMASDERGQWVFGLIKRDASARYPLVKITFVHELQHALRLCGIEHEIIL